MMNGFYGAVAKLTLICKLSGDIWMSWWGFGGTGDLGNLRWNGPNMMLSSQE